MRKGQNPRSGLGLMGGVNVLCVGVLPRVRWMLRHLVVPLAPGPSWGNALPAGQRRPNDRSNVQIDARPLPRCPNTRRYDPRHAALVVARTAALRHTDVRLLHTMCGRVLDRWVCFSCTGMGGRRAWAGGSWVGGRGCWTRRCGVAARRGDKGASPLLGGCGYRYGLLCNRASRRVQHSRGLHTHASRTLHVAYSLNPYTAPYPVTTPLLRLTYGKTAS